jgi:pyruvate/2-oxoglutarate dehydrogenase complex dihydrolipoamide acyltransferase (E2) component
LTVPHPVNGVLYVKLRDDPATVQTLTLPVTLVSSGPASPPPAGAKAAPAAQPQPAQTQPADAAPADTAAPAPKPDAPPNR